LKNLGHRVRSTIAALLRAEGIGPVPERPMSWRTFLAGHWGAIAAADFFTTEVWTARGLVRAADRAHRDGCGRRMPARLSRSGLRPRYKMERGLSSDAGGRWCPRDSDTQPGAQLQRVRGTIRPIDQRRMSGSLRVPRRDPPAADAHGLRGALPLRAESPRPTRPTDHASTERPAVRCDSLSAAARRAASVLLPSRLRIGRISGQYGVVECRDLSFIRKMESRRERLD
jgi:hypothetical protein